MYISNIFQDQPGGGSVVSIPSASSSHRLQHRQGGEKKKIANRGTNSRNSPKKSVRPLVGGDWSKSFFDRQWNCESNRKFITRVVSDTQFILALFLSVSLTLLLCSNRK